MKKKGFLISLTIFLCIVAIAYFYTNKSGLKITNISISFLIKDGNGEICIKPFQRGDGLYAFLPSYANMDDIILHTDENIYIDNKKIDRECSLSGYELNKNYGLRVKGCDWDHIQFVKSANVATMYIDTLSGNMDNIYNNKSYKESVTIKVVDQSGNPDCSEDKAKIKGRGNSTWIKEKKPFTIKLDRECNMLNIANNKEWNLLACGTQMTNIRNKLIYDFAREIGLPSPGCEYVDLYLNGEYNGLYLLTEKITPESDGLKLPSECQLFERDRHYDKNGFVTEHGQPIIMCYPDTYDNDSKSELMKKIQSMENAIISVDGIDGSSGRSYTELIDIESWAKKYLIEEVFGNIDAGVNSQFFYLINDTDDRIYAGPVWDYDLSMGYGDVVMNNPDCFIAQRQLIFENTYSFWYKSVYQKEEFYNYLVKEYKYDVLPMIGILCNKTIDDTYIKLKSASIMNAKRWQDDENKDETQYNIAVMKQYLKQHSSFLSSAWIDGVECCTVVFDDSNRPRTGTSGLHRFFYYTVKKGSRFDNMPSNEVLGLPEDVVWYDKKTDQIVNSQSVIDEDMELYVKPDGQKKNIKQMLVPLIIKHMSALLLGVFGIMLIAFIIIDLKRIMIQRRRK